MAKKQPAPDTAEAATPAGSDAPAAKKEPKKAREPKAKTSPATPAAESPAPPSAPAEAAPVSPVSIAPAPVGEPGAKKKRKQPGKAPPLGKKLKNHLRGMQQKIAKEGP